MSTPQWWRSQGRPWVKNCSREDPRFERFSSFSSARPGRAITSRAYLMRSALWNTVFLKAGSTRSHHLTQEWLIHLLRKLHRELEGPVQFCPPQHSLCRARDISFRTASWQQVDFSKWAERCAVLTLGGLSAEAVCGSAPKVLQLHNANPAGSSLCLRTATNAYVTKKHQGTLLFLHPPDS